jgi:hypothetical protein
MAEPNCQAFLSAFVSMQTESDPRGCSHIR